MTPVTSDGGGDASRRRYAFSARLICCASLMNRSLGLAGLLLSTALTPGVALAQVAVADASQSGPAAPTDTDEPQRDRPVDISTPGADLPGIVVIGRNIPQPIRDTPQEIGRAHV